MGKLHVFSFKPNKLHSNKPKNRWSDRVLCTDSRTMLQQVSPFRKSCVSNHWKYGKVPEALLVLEYLQKVKDVSFVKVAVCSELSYTAWIQSYKPKPELTVFVLFFSRTPKSRQWTEGKSPQYKSSMLVKRKTVYATA